LRKDRRLILRLLFIVTLAGLPWGQAPRVWQESTCS